jgi:hypothetical protein
MLDPLVESLRAQYQTARTAWVGRVSQLRADHRKPLQVRVVDVEIDNVGRLWFWAKNA